MINKDDLVSLSYEQKVRFRAAIEQGYFDDYEDNPREWKHSFVGSFLWKYPSRTATLARLRNIAGHIPQWEDMTDDLLRDFVDESLETIAASSVRTTSAELKAVLNANRRKIPSEDYMRILSVKGEMSQAIYLTREEMNRILRYKPITEQERFVRRNFLIEFLTGARLCDARRLTISHCNIGTGTLSYVPQKTPGIKVTVPVDERMQLRKLLAEDTEIGCCLDSFNEIIRRICMYCHIDDECTIHRCGEEITAPKWQLVSSHTARRSFATNLYLSGITLEDIALLMGHGKNIETTKRYICADRKLSRVVTRYFKKEKKVPADIEAKSYNKGIDDVLKLLISQDIISTDGLCYQAIDEMKLPTPEVLYEAKEIKEKRR